MCSVTYSNSVAFGKSSYAGAVICGMKEAWRNSRGIMLQTSLAGTLWQWSAARRICVLSLSPNSGLPRGLISQFSIHTEWSTSHVMSAVSSLSRAWGRVPCTPDCKHTELAALTSPRAGEEQHSSCHLLRCLQSHQRYSLRWQAGQAEASRQGRDTL